MTIFVCSLCGHKTSQECTEQGDTCRMCNQGILAKQLGEGTMKTVHLAGNDVRIERRIIQRCLICGYKLVDINLDRLSFVSTKPNDTGVSTWAVGHLIEVTEGNPTRSVDIGDTKQPQFNAAWSDCCINLVE